MSKSHLCGSIYISTLTSSRLSSLKHTLVDVFCCFRDTMISLAGSILIFRVLLKLWRSSYSLALRFPHGIWQSSLSSSSVLIDSGATHSFLDSALAKQHKLPLTDKPSSIICGGNSFVASPGIVHTHISVGTAAHWNFVVMPLDSLLSLDRIGLLITIVISSILLSEMHSSVTASITHSMLLLIHLIQLLALFSQLCSSGKKHRRLMLRFLPHLITQK